MGVFLAQSLVLFREEGLALQTGAADCTYEAGIMPGESQRLQKLVSGLDGEVTTMATGTKELVIISFAVWQPILHVEGVVSDWLLAGCTQEAVHMPGLLQGIDDFPQDLLLAAGAGRGKELFIAVSTVHCSPLLHEA